MNSIIPLMTASFAAGIWCVGKYSWLLPVLYSCSIVLLLLIVWQVHGQKPVIWTLGALFFVVGMVRFLHDEMVSTTDISHYIGQTMVIHGTIRDIPHVTVLEDGKSKVRYLVESKVGYGVGTDHLVPITGILPVTIRQGNEKPLLAPNDEIEVTGEIMGLHGYNNPAQYDSVAAAERQGIRARMLSLENGIRPVASTNKLSWGQALALWRENIIKNMGKVMPDSHAAILAGMLFGGYGGIPREIVDDFATTGIVHILSVSGSHIALVVGVITAVATFITSRFPLNAKLVPILAGSMVTFYAVFCGLTPPVLRSLVMGLIALFAVCFQREKDAGNGLLLSALGMLIYQPALLYDLSFQLSFASTAGLVFLNGKTTNLLRKLPPWLGKLMAVTISAQLGVLPFIAWYFNSFSISSFVANILIVPVIEGIVVLGLVGALVGMILGGAGNIIMVICSLLIGMVIQCTSWLAAVPGAKIYIPAASVVGGSLYYLLLAWVYGYKPKNVLSLTELVKQWPWCSRGFLLVMVGSIILYNVYPRPVRVHFIDVGQGDCTLVVTPHGQGILVDTGGTKDFDIGERVVVPYLRHYGVLDLAYLFLTHGHTDHAGGALAVARHMTVRNSMLPREPYSPAVASFVQRAQGSTVIPTYEQQEIKIDGVLIRVAYAPSSVEGKQGNEVSSVIQVQYGEHSFLLTGDLETKGEEAILASGKAIDSTVLKVGHHGAKTSSSTAFLHQVRPKYAVISVGANNSFGHPHRDTIQRLLAEQSKIYRTDQQGAIVFTTDGQHLRVETFIQK